MSPRVVRSSTWCQNTPSSRPTRARAESASPDGGLTCDRRPTGLVFREFGGLVAELDGRLVGTLALWRGGPDEETERFRRADAFVLGRFAVDPAVQRRGVGAALLAEAGSIARAAGAVEVLGDTAETATHLVDDYGRHGWPAVGHVHGPGKTHRSALLAKAL